MEDMSSHPQRWTIGRGYHCSQYWIVNIQALPNSCCSLSSVVAVVEDEVDVAERTLAVMETDEETRLREEDQRHFTFDFEQLVRRTILLLYMWRVRTNIGLGLTDFGEAVAVLCSRTRYCSSFARVRLLCLAPKLWIPYLRNVGTSYIPQKWSHKLGRHNGM
jgi:hypothetical protein